MKVKPKESEITKRFDEALENADSRPDSREYSNPDHAHVADLAKLYNVIKSSADPKFSEVKVQNSDAKTLNTLAHHLSNITFRMLK